MPHLTFLEKLCSCSDRHRSLLCVGLDPQLELMPQIVTSGPNPLLRFNREIIEATSDLVCAFKMNIAFYLAHGSEGWTALEETIGLIPSRIPTILDAKFGDIGNTSRMYARTAFETLAVDAVTVNPYLGGDAVAPFLDYEGKCTFVLCLTSNQGAADFQAVGADGTPLYQQVARKAVEWSRTGTCGLVVGATHADSLKLIRSIAPDLPFLVPGIGVQGGDLHAVLRDAVGDARAPVAVNVSRSVIYASSGSDFALAAREAAEELRQCTEAVL